MITHAHAAYPYSAILIHYNVIIPVYHVFSYAMTSQVVEGYGQTESSTLTSITNPRDLSDGHVGCIISCIQVKLVDVPDLQYFASNGQGEVTIIKPYF